MSLRFVNLNLLPILRVLLKEVSVTRAADVLGLSQSATSEALGRLREVLADPLLVQVGRTMRLTPRAEELIEPVERLCHDAEALLEKSRFDPAVSRRHFRIGCADFGVTQIGPLVIEMQRRFAPGISVSFLDFQHASLDRLASRDLDFAWLASFFVEDSGIASLRSIILDSHHLVVLLDRAHPLAQADALRPGDLDAWPMIGVELEPGIFKPGRLEALQGGLSMRPVVTVQHAMLQPRLVLGSQCWTLAPRCTAEVACREMGLVMREAPFLNLNAGDVCLAWSAVHDSDPAHCWFRTTLADLAEERKVPAIG